ncbi:MAG TPA: xanthine dehydrogenase family protein molybdopterin-binding subunit [Acidimicrobiia bacterium]|nr:xanthine dehydrogenase family protein molybdopterin-binding subunit [Acidimicrobiia bacterium]
MPDTPTFTPVSRRRREDRRFVTGAGRYVADLAPSTTLHLAFVRSPEAHASITGIDTEMAVSAEGVVGVFTATDLDLADIPGDSIAVESPDFPRPHLARRKVRYVGEPVAVVAAESPYRAADAADLVWVEYESLPAVSDPRRSLEGDVLLHDAAGTNVVERWELGSSDWPGRADVDVEIEVRNQRLAPTSIEPLAMLAVPEDDGHLTVYISHQRPHGFQARLSKLLPIDPEKLRVIVPDVGGAFGMKGMTYPEYTVAAALALRLGRPVLWAERRREHLSGGTHGRGSSHRVRLAGTSDGRVERAEIHMLADVGAYPHNGTPIPTFSRLVAVGLYDIPDLWLTTTSVVTNRAPTGSYRGAGRPEAAYAIERALDAFARAAGLDPTEVRLKNFIPSADLPYLTATGALYDSGDYAAALRRAVELVDLDELRAEQQRRRETGADPIGVGFGAFVERAGGTVNTGEYGKVEVGPEGTVVVRTGSTSSGQGHETAWSQIAAQALGVDPDSVVFVAGDTDSVARGTGTAASRSTQIGGSAVWRTAQVVRQRSIEIAADLLEASADDVVLSEGKFSVAGVPGSGIGWEKVAAAAAERGIELAAEEWYVPGAQTFPYGVHVAVVEVSLETGEVRLQRMVAVDDCGNVINPMIVEGQLHGSLMQGIGQAMYEGIQYGDDGQLLTATLMDYSLPRAADAPPIVSERLVHPAPSNALGAKGTGEAGCIGGPPAIVNAVLDALAPYGVRSIDMPLRPATVWKALVEGSYMMQEPGRGKDGDGSRALED